MNNLIDLARHIPAPEPSLTVAYTPIKLASNGWSPATGTEANRAVNRC